MKETNKNKTVKIEEILDQIRSEEAAKVAISAEGDAVQDPELSQVPTETQLSEMSAEERRDVYRRLLASIDEKVNEKVKALSDEYRRGIANVKDTTVKQAFSNSEKFGGFGENIAAIDGIIEKVPVLSTLPANEKYTLAYLINEGLKARNNKMGMSAEAIVSLVNSRPDVMRLLDAQRAKELSQSYGATPAFAASSGAASMPANIKSTPRNLDEASREAYSSFGIKL